MNPSAHFPIGIFDSGLGGLTILEALRHRLPEEDFIYFADTRHLPYGDKAASFIQARAETIATALLAEGAKAIVIACNTATAAAAERLRAFIAQPVIALEPAVKPAVAQSRRGIVGVLATTRTLASERFSRLLAAHARDARVLTQACPGLAEAIEAEGPHSGTVENLLDLYVHPLAQAGVDVVVLGCTHYPWVRPEIAARLPGGIKIVDSGEAVARQVEFRLTRESHLGGSGKMRLATSGDARQVRDTIARLCGRVTPVEYWDI